LEQIISDLPPLGENFVNYSNFEQRRPRTERAHLGHQDQINAGLPKQCWLFPPYLPVIIAWICWVSLSKLDGHLHILLPCCKLPLDDGWRPSVISRFLYRSILMVGQLIFALATIANESNASKSPQTLAFCWNWIEHYWAAHFLLIPWNTAARSPTIFSSALRIFSRIFL